MKLKTKKVREAMNLFTVITSGTHDVAAELENGKPSIAKMPYELEDVTRWYAVHNLEQCQRIVKRVDDTKTIETKRITGSSSKPIKQKDNAAAFDKWVVRMEELEETVHSVRLCKIKASGLKVSNDNPIPGLVIAGLATLGLLDKDIQKIEESSFIPDTEGDKEEVQETKEDSK